MRNSKFYKFILLVSILAFLPNCTIPKKIELTDIVGFNQSHCAAIKSDAFLVLWDFTSTKKLELAQLDIFKLNEEVPKFLEGRSERIPKGTHLKIDSIETWWDFENADRITIRGSVPFNSQEISFSFSSFTGPDKTFYIQKILTPC